MSLKKYLKLNSQQLEKLSVEEKIKFLRYLRKDYSHYDLRNKVAPQTKTKVNRDMLEFFSYFNLPGAEIKKSRKKNLKQLKAYTGQSEKWKVAIVPLAPGQKIKYTKQGVKIADRYKERRRVNFNKLNLAKDEQAEVERVLKNEKFDACQVICGSSLLGGYGSATEFQSTKLLKKRITYLVNSYENYNEWLHGLILLDFNNQKPVNKKTISEFNKKTGKNKNGKKTTRSRGR